MGLNDAITSGVNAAKFITKEWLKRNGLYSKISKKDVIVLMYHGVDLVQNRKYNQRFYSVANFEAQIRLFKKHFNILSHQDYVDNNLSKTRQNAVITFDDGYENNFKYALPVLEKNGVHAYFLVTGADTFQQRTLWTDAVDIVAQHAKGGPVINISGEAFHLDNGTFKNPKCDLKSFIKSSTNADYTEKGLLVEQLLDLYDYTTVPDMQDYWKLMSESQIRTASESKYITIGSHGFYHNNLGTLRLEEAITEVVRSKEYLESIVQYPVNTIGFPDGSYTEELNDAVYKAGVTNQFIVRYHFNDEGKRPFVHDRFGLFPSLGKLNVMLYKSLQ